MLWCAALYLLLGRPMLPFAQGWSLFLLWVCAHVGGFLAIQVGLPPLLGMLVAGIILKNIPQGQAPLLCSTSRTVLSCAACALHLWQATVLRVAQQHTAVGLQPFPLS